MFELRGRKECDALIFAWDSWLGVSVRSLIGSYPGFYKNPSPSFHFHLSLFQALYLLCLPSFLCFSTCKFLFLPFLSSLISPIPVSVYNYFPVPIHDLYTLLKFKRWKSNRVFSLFQQDMMLNCKMHCWLSLMTWALLFVLLLLVRELGKVRQWDLSLMISLKSNAPIRYAFVNFGWETGLSWIWGAKFVL